MADETRALPETELIFFSLRCSIVRDFVDLTIADWGPCGRGWEGGGERVDFN